MWYGKKYYAVQKHLSMKQIILIELENYFDGGMPLQNIEEIKTDGVGSRVSIGSIFTTKLELLLAM